MESIRLKISNETAEKWKKTDIRTKERLFTEVDRFLNTMLDKHPDDLWLFLEETRTKAEKKGFNDKILEKILNDDE